MSDNDLARDPSSLGLPWNAGFAPTELPPTVLRASVNDDAPDVAGAFPFGWRPRAEAAIAESWLPQVTVVADEGVKLRLQARLEVEGRGGVAGDQYADRQVPAWPLLQPLLIIGAVSGPPVTYPSEAAASVADLASQLALSGVRAIPAATVDRGHAWAEPSVIATQGLLDGQPLADWQTRTLDIARQKGVTTVVRVQGGAWEVLALTHAVRPRVDVVTSAACSITRDVEHRCPMQQTPDAGQYCRMRGGPWTSASIHAATGWQHHRDLLVAAVGCDTCEGVRYLFQGRVFTGGGPIPLAPIAMPTRWLAADETRPDARTG